MSVSLAIVTYLVVASVSLSTFAFIFYRQAHHAPELLINARLMASLGAVALVLASWVWMDLSLATQTARTDPARWYAESRSSNSKVR